MMSRFRITGWVLALGFIIAWMLLRDPWRFRVGTGILVFYMGLIGLGVVSLRFGFFGPVVSHGRRTDRKIALTFDDGPDSEETPAVLDVLRERGVYAAFFCIGRKSRANPDLVKQILIDGHLVGNHSEHHGWWTNFLWGRRLRKEILDAQEAIFEACGFEPHYYRPPAGLSNPHLFRSLAALGLICVGWDVRSFDTSSGPDMVIKRIQNKVRPGSIILLHDTGRYPGQTAGFLGELLDELARRDLTPVRLDELIGYPAYQVKEAAVDPGKGNRTWA